MSFNTGDSTRDEWPHPDYALAAAACASNEAARDKLRQLADDLESIVALVPGPGSLPRIGNSPAAYLKSLAGRCWREILTDDSLSPRAWAALRRAARVFKAEEMDEGSRRFGVVLHAIAVVRLESAGEKESDMKKRKRHEAERDFVTAQLYVPAFLISILKPGTPE